MIKKLLLSIAFVSAFGAAAGASAVTITSPTNSTDVYLASGKNDLHSTSFDLKISGFLNGFVMGFDTLQSAVLSVFLKDDEAWDGNETYKITLGAGSSTQNETGGFTDELLGYFGFWPIYGPGSVTENITLNTKALADLGADGIIKVTVETNNGDFNFDKAYLTANVTRGVTGGSPPASVPEPTTVALLGLGLLGVAASRRKSAKSKNA